MTGNVACIEPSDLNYNDNIQISHTERYFAKIENDDLDEIERISRIRYKIFIDLLKNTMLKVGYVT